MTSLTEAYYRRLVAFHTLSPVEEFYSKAQPRDKDGKWTRGGRTGPPLPTSKGKMWSGASAHPDNRTVPTPNVPERGEYEPRKEHAERIAKQVWETDLGGGYRSVVTDVVLNRSHGEPDQIIVTGEIRKDGRHAGSFDRWISTDEQGRLFVYHDSLLINDLNQGLGVGDRFNSHAVAEYQKMGVDRIELHAGDTVGGYAWARQGFRIDPTKYTEDETSKEWMLKQLNRVRVKFNISHVRPHKAQLEKEISALEGAIARGEDVQPIHIASLGERYARWTAQDEYGQQYETWPGKQTLLGTTWQGAYYFDAANPVTASASDLDHARLRPAFYDDVELQLMAEEFACHDASCRPPTSGGTGGSSPSKTASDLTEHQFHPYRDDPGMTKHFGTLAVAAHMTQEERDTIADELNFTVSYDYASHFQTVVNPNVHEAHIPVGLAMQMESVRQYRDSFVRSTDATQAQNEEFDKQGSEMDKAWADFRRDYWSEWVDPSRVGRREQDLIDALNGQMTPAQRDGIAQQKDNAVKAISRRIEEVYGISPASGFINFVNHGWMESSSSPISVAMQREVARQFDLDTKAFERFADKRSHQSNFVDPAGYDEVIPKTLSIATKAIYATSQDAIHAHGTQYLDVHRGVAVPEYAVYAEDRDLAFTVVKPNPLSSWTSDRDEAVEFSTSREGGYVFSANVPAEDVFSISALTGLGSLAEHEIILVGRPVRNVQTDHRQSDWVNSDEYSPNDFAKKDDEIPFYIDEEETNADWIKKVTPKSVVASYFTRCEHGNLTAACHDASCRPPTAGGTGGSRRRGSAESVSSKPLSSADGPTEFGRMINGLVQASGLYNLTQGAVQGVHESAMENRLRADQRAYRDKIRTLDAVEISAPYHLKDEPLLTELGRAKRELNNPNREDFNPRNKYEKILLDLVDVHVAKNEPYSSTLLQLDQDGNPTTGAGISLKVKPLNQPRTTLMSHEHIIPADAESKTTAIGTIIRDEINKRVEQQFDVIEHSNVWNDVTEKAAAIASKIDPTLTNPSEFEAWFKSHAMLLGTGADRKLTLSIQSGLKPDDRAAIESIFFRSGIKSTTLVGHIRNGQAEMHQSVLKDVLSEIRPMGGEFKDTPRDRKTRYKSSLSTNEQLTRAAPWYPSDWIKASNEAGDIEFKTTKTRAHYRHGLVAEVKLDGSVPTAVHELAHRMEYTVPGVRALEQQFYERRTAGEPLELLSKLYPGSRYGRNEWARKDEFFDAYAGKQYPDNRAYELMSMGMQSLPYRHSWDKMDPDYQAFILGVLATAYH